MTQWLIDPREPKELVAIGIPSATIEAVHGVDALLPTSLGLVGLQRKEIHDLFASAHSGRLGQQLNRMNESVAIGIVLIEGQPKWTVEGGILDAPGWSVPKYRGLLFSIQCRGYWVVHTRDLKDTVQTMEHIARWFAKSRHDTLSRMPNAKGKLGLPATREEKLAYVIQAIAPGIGPVVAMNIVHHFGRLPLRWDVTYDELLEVPKVGKGRVEDLTKEIKAIPF
jgi:ERCC4-type nuclease